MEIALTTKAGGRVSDLRSSIVSSGTKSSACRITYAKDREDVGVYIKSSLVYASRQGGVQALGETFGYNEFVRDLLELEVGLEGLHQVISQHQGVSSACVRTLSSCFRNAIQSAHSCTLSKAFKHFSTCWVYFLYFGSDEYNCWAAAVGMLFPPRVSLNTRRLTPFACFGGWLSGSRSTSV